MSKSAEKKSEEYVTMNAFEKGMESIANSFQQVDERFDVLEKKFTGIDGSFNKIFQVLATIREDNMEFKKRSNENEMTLLRHDQKIENMLVRVEKLEKAK